MNGSTTKRLRAFAREIGVDERILKRQWIRRNTNTISDRRIEEANKGQYGSRKGIRTTQSGEWLTGVYRRRKERKASVSVPAEVLRYIQTRGGTVASV